MDENYTDEFMDEDEDLYVEDENPDPEQEADMHKSIEPDSVDSVEVVRTAVIQENVQPQPMQNVPEPGEQAESDIDKLPYKGYITYLYNLFSDANKGLGHLDEEWKKVRAQVNSALQLKIPRKYIERLISLEYSYEQREVIKFMYFSGCSEEMVADMKPALTYKEMIAKYDATKVESAIVNMLDAPLNTMSRLVNEYKEDLAKYRKETEEKMASYEQQIKEKDMELAETKEELTNLQEEKKAEREKKSKEQLIQMEAERLPRRCSWQRRKSMMLKTDAIRKWRSCITGSICLSMEQIREMADRKKKEDGSLGKSQKNRCQVHHHSASAEIFLFQRISISARI